MCPAAIGNWLESCRRVADNVGLYALCALVPTLIFDGKTCLAYHFSNHPRVGVFSRSFRMLAILLRLGLLRC